MNQAWPVLALAAALAAPALIQAQEADPLAAALKRQFDGIALNLKEAAEAMPEAKYSFKPSPDVKPFSAEVGHAANANYMFCAAAKNEANPNKADFEKLTAKADLVKAMIASNEYCATAFTGSMMETVGKGFPSGLRAAVLAQNIAHANETYGTMVPYLRMSGVVPPSTARTQKK